jgi:hypothetical protein
VRSEASLRHEQDLKTEQSDFYANGLVGKPRVNATFGQIGGGRVLHNPVIYVLRATLSLWNYVSHTKK